MSPRTTRPTFAGSAPQCSCELLRQLAQRSPGKEVLAAASIDPLALAPAQAALHASVASEPADWHLRLAQRGASSSDLEQLLAIVRSADSHGYQLLTRLGISCAHLRRDIIHRLRAPTADRGGPSPGKPRRTPRPAVSGEPPRSNRAWRGRRERAGRPGPTVPDTEANAAEARADDPNADHPNTNNLSPAEALDPPPAQTTCRRTGPDHHLRSIDHRSLPPVHGRHRVLSQLADALMRHTPRPPVLVGASGSGRSLVARHLAQELDTPVFLLGAPDYDDPEVLGRDLDAIAAAGGVAIFDDLDRVPSDSAPPFLSALARAWSRRHPPVLTIASAESFARLDLWLPGGTTTFDRIDLEALGPDAIGDAVASAAPLVMHNHGVTLASDAKLGELTRLAERYLSGLAMPGRALDILDLACARTTRAGATEVSRERWVDIVSERSGLPRARIEVQDDRFLLELEQRLAAQVVGHSHVTQTFAQLIRRNRAGFSNQRPVLSTLLLGPSGVGKTELAKALGHALYERPDALVRLDMSEYSEAHAVARIVGAPPGYVGHEQGGALTDPLRARPHCVVLLDEIEKAHREVHQLLLQVLDEGRLTDGRGRLVELHHAVIVMTSNLGSQPLDRHGAPYLEDATVLDTARRAFPVELWNRIEAPLVLQPLSPDQMLEICRRLARASAEHLFHARGIRYTLSEPAMTYLVKLAGRDPSLGARPLRHLLVREVESVIAEAILRGRLRAGTQVEIDVQRGRIVLR